MGVLDTRYGFWDFGNFLCFQPGTRIRPESREVAKNGSSNLKIGGLPVNLQYFSLGVLVKSAWDGTKTLKLAPTSPVWYPLSSLVQWHSTSPEYFAVLLGVGYSPKLGRIQSPRYYCN